MTHILDPTPTLLWQLQRKGKVADCEARFVPAGVQVQITVGGALVISRIFSTGEEALEWGREREGADGRGRVAVRWWNGDPRTEAGLIRAATMPGRVLRSE